jgi:hypothetical protein
MSVISTCFTYNAFGLNIKSEIPLPELSQLYTGEPPEVEILIANLDLEFGDKAYQQGRIIVDGQKVMFQVSAAATFKIECGQRIIVSPTLNADHNKIRLYILGTCMGILLMQRKMLALHGSAVAIGGKAYAFVGDSGAGKSTLASAFMKNGYKLLTDDVIPVTIKENDPPVIYPTYPQQKLWEESLQYFDMDSRNYNQLFERENKFAIPIHSHYHDSPMVLGGLFEIAKKKRNNIIINPINRLERFRTLYNQTFRKSLIPRLGLAEWHFLESAKLIKNIKMYHIERPIETFTANDLVDKILTIISEEDN